MESLIRITCLAQLSSQSASAHNKFKWRQRSSSRRKILKGIPIINFKKGSTSGEVASSQRKNQRSRQSRHRRKFRMWASRAGSGPRARIVGAVRRARMRFRRVSAQPNLKACLWRARTKTLIWRRLSSQGLLRRRNKVRVLGLRPNDDPVTAISGFGIRHWFRRLRRGAAARTIKLFRSRARVLRIRRL